MTDDLRPRSCPSCRSIGAPDRGCQDLWHVEVRDSANLTPGATPRGDPRPFGELSDSGLLWLINRVVFHPRGYALSLVVQGGELAGWQLLGDGSEPWSFGGDEAAKFAAAQATFVGLGGDKAALRCPDCGRLLPAQAACTEVDERAEIEVDDLLAEVYTLRQEVEQLTYERRLLGFARMTLDVCAEYENLPAERRAHVRAEAADVAQRIVDEIGHPVTDEDALGPSFRDQLAAANATIARVRAVEKRYHGCDEYDFEYADCDELQAALGVAEAVPDGG